MIEHIDLHDDHFASLGKPKDLVDQVAISIRNDFLPFRLISAWRKLGQQAWTETAIGTSMVVLLERAEPQLAARCAVAAARCAVDAAAAHPSASWDQPEALAAAQSAVTMAEALAASQAAWADAVPVVRAAATVGNRLSRYTHYWHLVWAATGALQAFGFVARGEREPLPEEQDPDEDDAQPLAAQVMYDAFCVLSEGPGDVATRPARFAAQQSFLANLVRGIAPKAPSLTAVFEGA